MILLIGGARSGKSEVAVRMARKIEGPVTYVATGEARDDEMTERIDQHRAQRPPEWHTIEEPIELEKAITAAVGFVIVDCLTLWVANMQERGRDPVEAATACAAVLREGVVITNEVGSGIVPANDVARAYRHLLGEVNKIFGAAAERAFFCSAGRLLELHRAEDVIRVAR